MTKEYSWVRTWRALKLQDSGEASDEQPAVTFEAIASTPALILLGAPGMGKTYEARRAYEHLGSEDAAATFISLRRIAQIEDLTNALLHSPSFTLWSTNEKSVWTIFLDGFDEISVPVPIFANWLSSTLHQLAETPEKTERLHIRITSRAPEWSTLLERDLREKWGDQAVGIYVLQPLTSEDIGQVSNNADFKNQIQKLGLGPLAERPVTLKMLADLFTRTGHLPDTAVQLYLEGLRATIEEKNPARIAFYETDSNRLELHLLLLGRIATVGLLSGRPQIWTGLYSGKRPENSLATNELAGGHETLNGEQPAITDKLIREAIKAGPLTVVGQDVYEWAHQTFAEFLAARYLAVWVQPDALLNILSFTKDGRRTVFPQVREIAVWVASFNDDFRRQLINSDPDILLRSDMASASDDDRRQLLESLLERLAAFKLHDQWDDPRVSYSRLKHPGVSNQLRPYILDATYNNIVRRFAIEAAVSCNLVDLNTDLLATAKSVANNAHIRSRSIRALEQLCLEANANALRELLAQGVADDPDDEVRGTLLRALWPSHLSHDELFDNLTLRQNRSFFGSYWRFIHLLKPNFKDVSGVLSGLSWIARNPTRLSSDLEQVACQILVASFSFTATESVRESLAQIFIKFARAHEHFGGAKGQIAVAEAFRAVAWPLRKSLILRILNSLPKEDRRIVLWRVPWMLVEFEDLRNLVAEFPEWQREAGTELSVDMVLSVLPGKTPDQAPELWDLAARNPDLERALRALYSTDIEGPLAKYERERIAEAAKYEAPPKWQDTVSELTVAAEADPNQWWRVDLALLETTSTSGEYLSENAPDLTAAPRWKALSSEMHDRMVGLATRYLTEGTLTDTSWLTNDAWYRPAAAAYRAFRLLYSRNTIGSLPAYTWNKWASAIVGFSPNDSREELVIQSTIGRLCLSKAPQATLSAIQSIVSAERYPIGFDAFIESVLNDDIAAIVWNGVKNGPSASPRGDRSADRLALMLVLKRYAPAISAAKEQFENKEDSALPSTSNLASALTLHYPDEAWPLLESAAQRTPLRAKKILENIADSTWHLDNTPFLLTLHESQLADIYQWTAQWGIIAREPREGFGSVTPVDQLVDLRRAALVQLRSRGTAQSVQQLHRLTELFPSEHLLQLDLEAAQTALTKESWRSYSPDVVLRLVIGQTPKAGLKESIQADSDELGSKRPPHTASELLAIDERITLPIDDSPPSATVSAKGWKVLAVASEWASHHGGISTINRGFCAALAAAGCEVRCLLLEAGEDDLADAARLNVQLDIVPKHIGLVGYERFLTWQPPAGYAPDIVLGHDHITGRYALYVAKAKFGGAFFTHMVHTVPEELEIYKGAVDEKAMLEKGYDKHSKQLELCDAADLVAAVGPTIESYVRGDRPVKGDALLSIIPGYDEELAEMSIPYNGDMPFRVLFIGRAEDPRVKGVDIVLAIANALGDEKIANENTPDFYIRGVNFETANKDIHDLLKAEVDLKRRYVKFRPFSTNVGELRNELLGCSCVVMPSRTEGFGLVALEALSAGKPVLVTSSSGIARHLMQISTKHKINSPNVGEWIIEVDDDAQASALVWIPAVRQILQNRESAFKKAIDHRAAFRKYFDWKATARTFLDRVELLKAQKSQL